MRKSCRCTWRSSQWTCGSATSGCGIVRERMRSEPRTRALFAFVGKRGHTMKVLTWDGTGSIVVHKKLDAGKFELPTPTRIGDQHVIVSDALFEVIFKGVAVAPKTPRRRIH